MIRLNEEAKRLDPDEDEGPGPLESSDDEEEKTIDEKQVGGPGEREWTGETGPCWAFGRIAEDVNKRRGRWRDGPPKAGRVKFLGTIEPEGINTMKEGEGWEELTMYVDSGATETVVGEDMIMSVKVAEGIASRRGTKYETANGVRIPNLGEKIFRGVIEDGTEKAMTAQVCFVNKALLSVSKAVKAGTRVVFDDEGTYIEDKRTGMITWLKEEGGMYALKMWVKQDFRGPGKGCRRKVLASTRHNKSS